jgi:hypothetical protein
MIRGRRPRRPFGVHVAPIADEAILRLCIAQECQTDICQRLLPSVSIGLASEYEEGAGHIINAITVLTAWLTPSAVLKDTDLVTNRQEVGEARKVGHPRLAPMGTARWFWPVGICTFGVPTTESNSA